MSLSWSASETSRCCAPSCRLRSSRRRSLSVASTILARELRELPVRVGVRQRLRDELGEVREPALRAGRKRCAARSGCDERAPDLTTELDRCGGCGVVAEARHALDDRSRKIVVAVNPLRLTRVSNRGEDSGPVEAHARADRERERAASTPCTDERNGVVRVEAREAGRARSDCSGRLDGDLLEHALRCGLAGDERGDPSAAQPVSAVSSRCASSLADRSAVTAASTSEVKAATATNSWVASRLCVMDARTNGPEPCAVFHTVSAETIATVVAAPAGPKRSAAQMRTGKTM